MVLRVKYKKNSYLNNYLKKLCCQTYYFNFQFNQDCFFVKHIKFEKCQELKKKISEELMPIAWLHKKWWNFCMSEGEGKDIEPIFTE